MSLFFLKLARRNLGRNLRRSLLSVLGIALGCSMAVLLTSMLRGSNELYARAAAETGVGHLKLLPRGFLQREDLKARLERGRASLFAARALPGVQAAAPRARAEVLLALGNRLAGTELVGVDPEAELRANRLVRKLAAGRYLRAEDQGQVVLGLALAERLEAEIGDELVVTLVTGAGSMQSAMLTLVGVVSTGSPTVDAVTCQVTLEDLARLTGLPGIAEVSLLLENPRQLEWVRRLLAPKLPSSTELVTWEDVVPDMAQHLKQHDGLGRLLSAIVAFVVLLGVTSANLTAVLERRKEFAVLAAIGMKPRRLVSQLFLEGFLQGLCGAAIALAVCAPLVYVMSTRGIDLRAFMQGDLTFEGVWVEPKIRADFSPALVTDTLAIGLVSTFFASLYPALFAVRTDPATALRVAQ